MPKGDDGVMDNLDSRVERVEVFNAETQRRVSPRRSLSAKRMP